MKTIKMITMMIAMLGMTQMSQADERQALTELKVMTLGTQSAINLVDRALQDSGSVFKNDAQLCYRLGLMTSVLNQYEGVILARQGEIASQKIIDLSREMGPRATLISGYCEGKGTPSNSIGQPVEKGDMRMFKAHLNLIKKRVTALYSEINAVLGETN